MGLADIGELIKGVIVKTIAGRDGKPRGPKAEANLPRTPAQMGAILLPLHPYDLIEVIPRPLPGCMATRRVGGVCQGHK